MAKKNDTSIARAGFSDDLGAKRSHKTFTILPSKIMSNHERNYARAPVYSLAAELPELVDHPALESKQLCFTRAEVLARVESLRANNQRLPIKVWRTNTHAAYVAEGFLRHIAALYMEVTGELAQHPGLRDGLRCEAEEQPKTPEGQVQAAWSNHAENADRKSTTPIDDAWLCKRLIAMQVPRAEIAARLGQNRGKETVSERTIDRLLQLLTLSIDTQLAVHEGRKTVAEALGEASKRGEGTARGQNPGIQRRAMRRRKPDNRPDQPLSPEQTDMLMDVVNGDLVLADVTDPLVKQWAKYLDAPTQPREPKTERKKRPRKPGETPEVEPPAPEQDTTPTQEASAS